MKQLPRWIDFFCSALGLLILSPFLFFISLLIKLTSRGPVFYISKRIGRDGIAFQLYKFRSMSENADKIGSGITSARDGRITPLGVALRRFKLDELPQLINVFKGDITLVGPRPEDPRFVELYPVEYKEILSLKPGITSKASLNFKNESALLSSEDHEKDYVENILPRKLRMDLEYFRRASFFSHIRLIIKTVLSVFGKQRVE